MDAIIDDGEAGIGCGSPATPFPARRFRSYQEPEAEHRWHNHAPLCSTKYEGVVCAAAVGVAVYRLYKLIPAVCRVMKKNYVLNSCNYPFICRLVIL